MNRGVLAAVCSSVAMLLATLPAQAQPIQSQWGTAAVSDPHTLILFTYVLLPDSATVTNSVIQERYKDKPTCDTAANSIKLQTPAGGLSAENIRLGWTCIPVGTSN